MVSWSKNDEIGPYSVNEEISHGGMAKVFLVSRRGKEFALKISRANSQSTDRDQFNNIAIRKEANLLKKIRHRRIVKIYPIPTEGQVRRKTVYTACDAGNHGKPWYFVMEYLAGGTLEDFVKEYGPLNVSEATNIVGNIALGLFHLMEEYQVTHNDVSLKNILFRSEVVRGKPYDPVLIDFGSAAGTKRFRDEAGAWFIMAPERIKIAIGKVPPEMVTQLNPEKIDVWSLGIMLYYCLSQELPFSSRWRKRLTSEILNDQPQSVREYNKKVPVELDDFIIKNCLCKDYRSRPSIQEVLNILKAYGSGSIKAINAPKAKD